MTLKPNERPQYDKALNALSEAHTACFKHEDRDVLGMSHGSFSGVNEALRIVLDLETALSMQLQRNKDLLLELANLKNEQENKTPVEQS